MGRCRVQDPLNTRTSLEGGDTQLFGVKKTSLKSIMSLHITNNALRNPAPMHACMQAIDVAALAASRGPSAVGTPTADATWAASRLWGTKCVQRALEESAKRRAAKDKPAAKAPAGKKGARGKKRKAAQPPEGGEEAPEGGRTGEAAPPPREHAGPSEDAGAAGGRKPARPKPAAAEPDSGEAHGKAAGGAAAGEPEGSLHPSWVAQREAKAKAAKLVPGSGKKTVFE